MSFLADHTVDDDELYPEESDCVRAVRRPKRVTETGLIVRQ